MSKFQQFFKQNKIKKSYVKFKATKSLLDENGEPLEWTIKSLTTDEDQKIRAKCYYKYKNGNNEEDKFDFNKYINMMLCACIIEPNLYDKDLQDSYNVMTPEELLLQMIDNPTEYDALTVFVKGLNNENSINTKIEEVKN